MTTLLRDVITIPERVGSDDYVLRLTDSTNDEAHIRATLDEYVITESLRDNFTAAIDLVADALNKNTSRAAYLTGSFGSGKSHFMAVLYALLGNHAAIRTAKFQDLTGRYDGALAGKNVLRLTYHLLGAKSLEQAILKGYVEQITQLHPDAPLPAVHVSDSLLADAENLRNRMSDGEFLAGLGGGSGGGWGGLLGADWDLPRYQAARQASAEDSERRDLVSALVNTYFKSFTETADYIDLDRGLVVVTEHAKSLGYDGVVLFLDELVLWLAFSVRDTEFFARESQKITKLVESSGRQRAIPLISFISRQMDLRKWFADAGASGAEQEAIDRAFQYQQGRFREIQLGDDNLAEVAHARLLQPKDDAARRILDEAFANLTRSPSVWEVLQDSLNIDQQHRGASEQEFRLTYPFSPALISTLRNLSSVMQRERTALKVMQRMLVDRRDTLTVDDLIPVGDSYDYVVDGGDPIDGHAGAMFKSANDLYKSRLLPALLDKHSVSQEQLDNDPASVPGGFRGQERIAKTLLLSAIAPKVPALRDITSDRLASLNHGSIKSRMAGGEARTVLAVVREWASKEVPEINVSDGTNPVIRVQLADVDYQSILERVRGEDNSGRRRVLLRRLIHKALGVSSGQDDLSGAASRTVIWRGSRREIDIVFGNVRDASSLPEQTFDHRPGTWRIVVDYPFDEAGFTSADDVSRIDRLLSHGDRNTLVWLPRFFTDAAMDDLALLVKLDWLFTGSGDRWTENSDHLSATDRAQARGILENLLSGTLTSIESLLKQAYGTEPHDPKRITDESTQFDVLTSLSREFSPAMPPAASLEDALLKLVDQAFTATYPSHPAFDPADDEVTARNYETVRDYVEQASAHRDGRIPTNPGTDRKAVRRVAAPLRVGKATEDHYLFGEDSFAYWAGELDRAALAADPVTIGILQNYVDGITPAWGLSPEARDLVISAWALLRKRAWFEAGQAISPPALGRLRPNIELRAEELPEQQAWDDARSISSKLFGYTMPRTYLTGANAAEFATQIRAKAAEGTSQLSYLSDELETAYQRLGMTTGGGDRRTAAQALRGLLDTLQATAGTVPVINAMASVELPVAPETAGQIRSDAARDTQALRSFRWKLVEKLHQGVERSDASGDSARAIEKALHEAISIPGRSLSDELSSVENKLVAWVVDDGPVTPPPPSPLQPGKPKGDVTLKGAADIRSLTADLEKAVAEHGTRVHVRWWVE
ncbi:phage resistance protein [Mycobacterium frederiksbergense]|uniref:DUF6079 family protein n=1 Tax=Mycolicibacterium frederiksbergense TaxID=117567 RepID=UPI0021F2A1D5|nr:DUF6079 family protein [Mycolicibacterium frederiksbergense]MCV7046756.1 phage resistance protein [Mycolicibacterium frederiksbergense]